MDNEFDGMIPLNAPPEGLSEFGETYSDVYEAQTAESSEGDPPAYKPFPFALRPSPEGIQIYYGVLVHQINKLEFDDEGLYLGQSGLSNPETAIPAQFEGGGENRYKFYDLDWTGDVFLSWKTDPDGVVEECEFTKDEPEAKPLPAEGDGGGSFYVKIGSVTGGADTIDQNISSDVYWISAFAADEESSSSSSDSGSDGDGGDGDSNSGGDDSGSDKSTAIVPMPWHEKGYGALFTMESNEVLFEFVMRDISITGSQTKVQIDDRFLAVCAPDTMVITGWSGDKAGPVGAIVEGNEVVLSSWPIPFLRPNKVTLKLTGVRKGFSHMDMPERSRGQFVANEKFLNSAYPKE